MYLLVEGCSQNWPRATYIVVTGTVALCQIAIAISAKAFPHFLQRKHIYKVHLLHRGSLLYLDNCVK